MGGADVQHDRDRRRGDRGQCRDVAGMARRHLQNQIVGVLPRPQHRPRGAQLVVERTRRGDHLAQRGEHRGDEVLGRGLTRRAGDADDRQAARHQFRGHRGGQLGQCGEHRSARAVGVVLQNAGGRVGSGFGAWRDDDRRHSDRSRGQHRDGTGRHRRRREVVAVRPRAGQREEQPALGHRARVELDGAGHPGRRGVGGRDVGELTTDDVGDLGQGQGDHARDPSVSRDPASSSRSSNGRV